MADKTPDRTFHDPDPSLDDPVAAAWFESLNALAFDVFEGAVNKGEARKFLNLSNVVAATEPTADAYEADLGGDLATGDVFEVDVPAANDTSSPTFENTGGTPAGAQSIVTTEGAAFANMLEARPHRVKWDGTNFVVLDPAGGVVDRGSNANGKYVRWGSGEQFCWITAINLTYNTTNAIGREWTFPASFVDANSNVSMIATEYAPGTGVREATPVIDGITTTNAGLRVSSPGNYSSGDDQIHTASARGYWK